MAAGEKGVSVADSDGTCRVDAGWPRSWPGFLTDAILNAPRSSPCGASLIVAAAFSPRFSSTSGRRAAASCLSCCWVCLLGHRRNCAHPSGALSSGVMSFGPRLRAPEAPRDAHRIQRRDHGAGRQFQRHSPQLAERHRLPEQWRDLVHRSVVRHRRLLGRVARGNGSLARGLPDCTRRWPARR